MFTLNCKGKIVQFSEPAVMGIINATPDSFYEGHLLQGVAKIVEHAASLISQGAEILDIGGQSTRPGSERVSPQVEQQRVLPVITAIHQRFPGVLISVDTYYSSVAAGAVAAGACMVNDISSGDMDSGMIPLVAALQVPYICMHMKGEPGTMQQQPRYDNLLTELLDYFANKIHSCTKAGIKDIIIDPGFGFGKSIEHNLWLLKNLGTFKITGKPILAGLSRKSTVYKTLGITAGEALNGTTVLNTLALQNGADILRVHDALEARQAVRLLEQYKKIAL